MPIAAAISQPCPDTGTGVSPRATRSASRPADEIRLAALPAAIIRRDLAQMTGNAGMALGGVSDSHSGRMPKSQ
jgi:hypothetical protein